MPAVIGGTSDTAAAIVVAVDDAAGAHLRLVDHAGILTGIIAVSDATSVTPLGGAPAMAWPFRDRDGTGRIVWVDIRRQRQVATLALPGTRMTLAAVFGTALASGGGSHWHIGASQKLVMIRDTLVGNRLGEIPLDPEFIVPPTIIGAWKE